MDNEERINDYDSEPVAYCSKCYYLKIKHDDYIDQDCCMECGCTDIIESPVEVWEQKYEKKYGRKFTEKTGDIRKSPIFKLPLSKLMNKVADSPKWEWIIRQVYNCFPKGLSKADSVVLFFDKMVKDNKLDALRTLLYNMKI